MAKLQDIVTPQLQFTEGVAAPDTPASGVVRIYAKDDGLLYSKDDAGTEKLLSSVATTGLLDETAHDLLDHTGLTGCGGDPSPLTTKGDIYVHGSADARLPVGTDGQILTADAAQALGVKWAAASGGGGALYKSGTQVDVINTMTETTVINYTIPGGTIDANGSIKMRVLFDLNHGVLDANSQLLVKMGGTTILTLPYPNGLTDALKPNFMNVVIANCNNTGSQIVFASTTYYDGSVKEKLVKATAAIDTTANQDLTMTMKFGVADPSNWYKQYHVVIDKEA